MTIRTNNNPEKIMFSSTVLLWEFDVVDENTNVDDLLATLTNQNRFKSYLLSHTKNLMGLKSDIMRAHKGVAVAIENATAICEHSDLSAIDLLYSLDKLTIAMLKNYRQDFWIVFDNRSDEEMLLLFEDLRQVFYSHSLNEQIDLLLKSVSGCYRLWFENNRNILQVFIHYGDVA